MTKLDDLKAEHAVTVSGEALRLMDELNVPPVAPQLQRLLRIPLGRI